MSFKIFRVLLFAALLTSVPRLAGATSILVNGDTQFTVSWLNSATTPDLSGSARFTVSSFDASGFDVSIDQIKNTMPVSPDINAHLVSFGFGLTPDALSYSVLQDGLVYSWGFSNFPGYGTVEVCGYAGSNCAGGAGLGLGQGESTIASDVMKLHVTGSFEDGVTFSPIPARFQSDAGTVQFDSTLCTTCGEAALVANPEPASLLLFGTGLAVCARRLRSRRAR